MHLTDETDSYSLFFSHSTGSNLFDHDAKFVAKLLEVRSFRCSLSMLKALTIKIQRFKRFKKFIESPRGANMHTLFIIKAH